MATKQVMIRHFWQHSELDQSLPVLICGRCERVWYPGDHPAQHQGPCSVRRGRRLGSGPAPKVP